MSNVLVVISKLKLTNSKVTFLF